MKLLVRHGLSGRSLTPQYVAVTRARSKLVILDGSEAAQPMQALWAERGLIDSMTPQELEVLPQSEAQQSSAEDWEKQGRSLFGPSFSALPR